MEKSNRIAAQVYAYTVCLVAVITFLITVTSVVNAVLDLGDPLHAGFSPQGTPSLASYEIYKADVLKAGPQGGNSYAPDEQTLKSMYEAAREDKIQATRYRSRQTIITAGLSMLIAVVLFLTHWMWAKKFAAPGEMRPAAG
jgi:hypothetical protein